MISVGRRFVGSSRASPARQYPRIYRHREQSTMVRREFNSRLSGDVLAPWAVDLHAHLGSQNPKAILDIMVRDALDETGENFLRLILGRVFH